MMANDRIILAHKPTGRAIVLGKKLSSWSSTHGLGEILEKFFDLTFEDAPGNDEVDNFVLLFECSGDIEWDYDRAKSEDPKEDWVLWVKWENEAWRKAREDSGEG